MDDRLNSEEKRMLLEIAREALEAVTAANPLPDINIERLPPALKTDGVSFVTLTNNGQLRGCIGALESYQPLAVDVQEHAAAAATADYRFPPVRPEELPSIEIEISRLTPKKRLEYEDPQNLLEKTRPYVDGVLIQDGIRRATFLPQVWSKVVNPEDFFDHLCMKMGARPDLWRVKPLEVYTYQVEEFREE